MDSALELSRLAMTGMSMHLHHHHHLLHLHQMQQHHHHDSLDSHVIALPGCREQKHHQTPPDDSSPLRFSVVNILRPDFGRDAIITRVDHQPVTKTTPKKVIALPAHSPLALPRDLSLDSNRLSPRPPASQSPPLELSSSNLSRSASLESLASSRSSIGSSSINGGTASSLSSVASTGAESLNGSDAASNQQSLWPAWIYCTRYSDRPSSGPRTRRVKRSQKIKAPIVSDEKRPRTAFSGEQLAKLRDEFTKNKYLNEERRQKLSKELGLNEQQIKIWFQNKRAKIKKATGQKNPLALQLMAQGLYNHSTVPVDGDEYDETSR